MKNFICTTLGVVGGIIANAFGGWDALLGALVFCMIVDYLSGVIVAAVFHKSKKTESGSLKSWEGFKGLCRKGMILLIVLVGYRLDLAMGFAYIRDGCIIGFMANEVLSIVENAGLMGLPLPEALTNAVDVLTSKSTSATLKTVDAVGEAAIPGGEDK